MCEPENPSSTRTRQNRGRALQPHQDLSGGCELVPAPCPPHPHPHPQRRHQHPGTQSLRTVTPAGLGVTLTRLPLLLGKQGRRRRFSRPYPPGPPAWRGPPRTTGILLADAFSMNALEASACHRWTAHSQSEMSTAFSPRDVCPDVLPAIISTLFFNGSETACFPLSPKDPASL